MKTALHRLGRGFLAGAILGLLVFLVEAVLLLKSGAIGLKIDTSGPFAALMQVVRPMLPALLGKIALVYGVVGGIAGLFPLPAGEGQGEGGRSWAKRGLWLLTWIALWLLFAWEDAVLRPALFDDLPGVHGILTWIVDHGEPWHPRVLALGAAVVTLGLSVWRRDFRAVPLMFGLVLFGSWPRSIWTQEAPPSPQPSPAGRGGMVLIGIDAFRVDRLRVNGSTSGVAPHVDAFLEEATLFTRAFTPIAQTEPAWRSLLTANWPHETGVRYPLTPQSHVVPMTTFPTLLEQAGWSTHFATDCSRFHFEDAMSGFTSREQPPRGAINFLLEKLRFRAIGVFADNALGAWWLPEFLDNRALAGTHDPLGYTERLAESWSEAMKQGPALVSFHATAAHFPGDPTYPFYRRFVSAEEPLSRRVRMHFSPIAAASKGGWTQEGSEALYDELLAQADAQVGLLFAELKRAGLYDESLIVLFSDHGESFHADRPDLAGATPLHGARLGAEENQILLAVKLPKSQGRVVSQVHELVRLIDVGPTLLEHAKLSPLENADGVSFLSALRREPLEPRMLYAETGITHALPEVFDPEHAPGTPRTFSLYRIRPDGVVEVTPEHHASLIGEKDVGAFDGKSWVIDSPRKDGTVLRRCSGACEDPSLGVWLDQQLGTQPRSAVTSP